MSVFGALEDLLDDLEMQKLVFEGEIYPTINDIKKNADILAAADNAYNRLDDAINDLKIIIDDMRYHEM